MRRPKPTGSAALAHDGFAPVLSALAAGGLSSVNPTELDCYTSSLDSAMPDSLTRPEALAFWINLYNAHAIRLTIDARSTGLESVLDLRGSFDRPVATIAGERLSLMDIEHGKIRRFRDPRIHGSLVCGSLSCPTLRGVPFTGADIDGQLDDQLRSFLERGGAVLDGQAVSLSRVFLWYGADFVRPGWMPYAVPASKRAVASALVPWLAGDLVERIEVGAAITFQSYDWGLGCAVT